jgi:hypothetical protein
MTTKEIVEAAIHLTISFFFFVASGILLAGIIALTKILFVVSKEERKRRGDE